MNSFAFYRRPASRLAMVSVAILGMVNQAGTRGWGCQYVQAAFLTTIDLARRENENGEMMKTWCISGCPMC